MKSEEFIEKYGEVWYLRDFDFLPERLSYRVEHDELYEETNFLKEVIYGDKGIFVTFKKEEDALINSIKVRELFNLNNQYLKMRLGELYLKQHDKQNTSTNKV